MDANGALGLPELRTVDVNGPVAYREWPGPAGAGATFVLVHGFGGSMVNWGLVAPGLAEHGRVLALDLAGFGDTPAAGRTTHVGANRLLLDGFIRVLTHRPVTLVGNSMGGMITLIQAAHAPDSVERLVLVDAAFPREPSVRLQYNPRIAAGFAAMGSDRLGGWIVGARTERLGPERLVRATLAVCAADPASIDPRLVAAMVENAERRRGSPDERSALSPAARSLFRAQVRPGKYRELVRRVTTPALVMHGALDRLVPLATAQRAAADHANWRLEVFPDLGHIPMMEAPARWLDAVAQWLGDQRGSAGDPGISA